MCWLYSVKNLLVIQHLETLYLGENYVRVVCEKVWRNAQDSAVKQRLAARTRGWLAACKPPKVAHAQSMQGSWTVMPPGALQDKKSRLAIKLARGLNSRLSQVARSSHQPALFLEKLTLRILFSHQYKYPSFPQNMCGHSERKTLREVSSKHQPN